SALLTHKEANMNPLAWIPVAIAVLQVIKENWDD
ncbi:hypothetical protein HNQ38_001095, partial [Desulfovibrio intestinalis]|nr:hypothetical protein [Desulfovibrio intestinalis]